MTTLLEIKFSFYISECLYHYTTNKWIYMYGCDVYRIFITGSVRNYTAFWYRKYLFRSSGIYATTYFISFVRTCLPRCSSYSAARNCEFVKFATYCDVKTYGIQLLFLPSLTTYPYPLHHDCWVLAKEQQWQYRIIKEVIFTKQRVSTMLYDQGYQLASPVYNKPIPPISTQLPTWSTKIRWMPD